MQKRKCFGCDRQEHIARNYKVGQKKKVATLQYSNRFEMLKSRIINIGEVSGKEVGKDKNIILRKRRKKQQK